MMMVMMSMSDEMTDDVCDDEHDHIMMAMKIISMFWISIMRHMLHERKTIGFIYPARYKLMIERITFYVLFLLVQ